MEATKTACCGCRGAGVLDGMCRSAPLRPKWREGTWEFHQDRQRDPMVSHKAVAELDSAAWDGLQPMEQCRAR